MKTVKGNLIDLAVAGKFDVIMHGCNCFCTMGRGIAKEMKEPNYHLLHKPIHLRWVPAIQSEFRESNS